MNGSNKILTVSYGTFSCTLEGFEDPFNSMRSIAEYFRDLAADDRYFGAEPPTPDVEMLQALAERGTRGRVAARVSDTGVALTVADDRTAKGDDTAALALDDDFTSDEPEDALIIDAADGARSAPGETIADKLSRIRAVVSRQQSPVSAEDFAEDDNAPEPPRSRALTRTLSDIAADIAGDDAETEVSPGELDDADGDDDWSVMAESRSDGAEDEKDDADTDWSESLLTESIDAVPGTETDDDDTADAGDDESIAALSLTGDDGDDAQSEPTDTEMAADMKRANDAANDDSDDMDIIDEDDDAEDGRDDLRAKAALFAVRSDAQDDDGPDAQGIDDAREASDEDDGLALAMDEASETDADDEDLREIADPEPEAFFSPSPTERSAALDSEAAEEEDDFEEEHTAGESDAPGIMRSNRRESRLLEPVDEDEAGVGRLMNEAEGKLADDDSVRRRRVISQMRAAVAATRADRILSRVAPQRNRDTGDQPYRRDLDKAVAEPRTSTPLVLVSAQRVMEPSKPGSGGLSRGAAPSGQDAPQAGAGGHAAAANDDFARFVEDMKARNLPELLEAAAAFSAFVEGEPHFSRPDLMRKVAAQASEMHMSREQGLRSFGQLLREGKIRKLQRGQFTIDEGTRFNPAHRIAGE